MKRILSIVLTLSMVLGLCNIPAIAVEEDHERVYLIYEVLDAEKNPLTGDTISADTPFYFSVKFLAEIADNNPIYGYGFFTEYDTNLVMPLEIDGEFVAEKTDLSSTINPRYDGQNYVYLNHGTSSGMTKVANFKKVAIKEGTLGYAAFVAQKDTTAAELLNAFQYASSIRESDNRVKNSEFFGKDSYQFNISQLPALSVDDITSGVYVNSTLKEVQNLISAKFIDASGTASAVSGSALDISVKDYSGFQLHEGNNVLVAKYNGKTCEFNVTAEAVQVTDLEITTQPKLDYVSGEKLDLSSMVVKATYSHGAPNENYTNYTTSIEDNTALTVADHNGQTITVTDNSGSGKTADAGTLTVTPKPVQIPTAAGTYTYNGNSQTFTIGNDGDKAYYTISGETSGTNAGTYTATVVLKSTVESQWADTFDGTLSWTIAKADPTANDFVFTAPGNLEYNGSGKTATVAPKSGITGMGTVTVKYNDSETAPSVVGEYSVSIAVAEGDNYNAASGITSDAWKFKITKEVSSVTDVPTAKTGLKYTGQAQQLIDNLGTASGGTMHYSLDGTTYVADAAAVTATDAGTYTVYYKVIGDANHSDVDGGSITVTVGKADPTVDNFTFNAPSKLTYNGSPKEATVALVSGITGMGNITVKYNGNETAPSVVGEYTVSIAVDGEGKNYNAASDITSDAWKFSIQKAAPTVTAPTAKTGLKYTGQAQQLIDNPGTASGGTMHYSLDDTTYVADAAAVTATDAGTYTVYYKVVGDGNYSNVDANSVSVTIAPKGLEKPTVSGSYTYIGSEQSVKLDGVDADTMDVTGGDKGTDAKEYIAKVALKNTNNYTWSDGTTAVVELPWRIAKADATVTAPTPVNNLKYTGNAQALVSGGSTADGILKYSLSQNGEYSTAIPTGTAADKYEVWYKVEGDNNHNDTTPAKVDVSIARKDISSDVTIGAIANQTFTGSGLEPALTVTFGEKTLVKDTDYTVAYTNNINAGTAATATITGIGNYSGETSQTFSIDKAAAPAVADVTLNVYYGHPGTVNVTFTGIPANAGKVTKTVKAGSFSNPAGLLNAAPTAESFQLNSGLTENAVGKSASWVVTISSDNYADKEVTVTVTAVNVTFKVGSADATADNSIIVNSSKLTYGSKWSDIVSKPANFAATVNQKTDNTQSNFKLIVGDADLDMNAVPAAGDYTVKVMYSGTIDGKQYTNVKVAEKAVTVAKAALTVTADNKSITFGDDVPTYTAQYSGFVNDETASALGGKLAFACSYAKGSDVGAYDITPSGLTSENYTFNYEVGTLTVAQYDIANATVTVDPESRNYNGNPQVVDVTVKVGGTTLSDTNYDVIGNTATAVGTYTITVTGKGNYTGTNTSKSWTMLKAAQETPLTISGAENKTYGDAPFTVTVGGGDGTGAYQLASSNTAVLTVAAGSAADKFTVTVVGAGEAKLMLTRKGDNNYADLTTAVESSVTVAKGNRSLTVEPASTKLIPGSLTAQITPTAADLDHSATYTYSSDKPLVAAVSSSGLVIGKSNGSATVTVKVSGSSNYNEDTVTVSVSVVTEPVSKPIVTGGGTGSQLTASIEGDTIKVSGIKTSEAAITVDFANKETDFSTRTADGKLEVLYNSQVVAAYKVDTSAVVMKDPTVDLKNEQKGTISNSISDNDKKTAAETAMNSADTKVEGVTGSVAEKLQEEAKKLVKDNVAKVEVAVTVDISAKELTTTTFKLDITPKFVVTTKNASGGTVETKAAETVPNSFFTTAVTVSVKLPSGLDRNNLVAKHDLGGGKFEWLAVTINGDVASWQQSSFAEVTLVSDSRSAVIDFHKDSGATETTAFGASSIGSALPSDTKSGSTFSGWLIKKSDGSAIDGFAAAQTVLTDELLTALNGLTGLTAEPVFTQNYVPSYGGGGSSVPTYSVSVSNDKNGTVKVSPSNAKKGATVTISVTPAKGYELDTLNVTDKNGNTVKVTAGKDGKYTFVMPASKVTVKAAFTKIEEAKLPFVDVADNFWARDAIAWAYENGYMNGNSAETFNPTGSVTRQQLWMILARLSGNKPASMAEARVWAIDNGISDGSNPGNAVSRQQMVAILYRYTQLMGYKTSGSSAITDFPDSGNVAGYAQDAMAWSVGNGIVGGTTQGTLNPGGTANRAQFATILQRFCKNIVEE